jgi:dihydrodipicolinate synthase/N-acetylneuraminate lyase
LHHSELAGTIVPLVTPLTPEEAFDPQGMGRLIEYVLHEGADALMATALTGEGPLLTLEETLAVWDFVFAKSENRIPVVPAIISTTTQRAVRLVRFAQEKGAPAVMAVPILPELYAGRSYDDVYAFYSEIASSTSLPLILFNYPSLTGIDFVPPLIERLASIENVRYIKESTDLNLARRIYYRQILPFVDVMSRNFNPTGTIKAGVCARGVEVGAPRKPGSPVNAEDQRLLERLVKEVEALEKEIEQELQ